MGDPGFEQKECWVLTPVDGWKYDEVHPGGIRRIWRDWEVPPREGRVGEMQPVPETGALSGQEKDPGIAMPGTIEDSYGGLVERGHA